MEERDWVEKEIRQYKPRLQPALLAVLQFVAFWVLVDWSKWFGLCLPHQLFSTHVLFKKGMRSWEEAVCYSEGDTCRNKDITPYSINRYKHCE